MRANTGGHAVGLPCPQCARTWSTEQTLAGHLMDAHGMAPSPAVARAMQAAHEMLDKRHRKVGAVSDRGDAHEPPDTPVAVEERAMSAKVCGYCKSTEHVYHDCAKAKAFRARKASMAIPRKDAKPKASADGNLVEHIRRLKADMERGQAAERELAEVRKLLEARGR